MKGKRSIRIVLLGILSVLLAPLVTAYPVHAAGGGPVFSLTSASDQPTAVGGGATISFKLQQSTEDEAESLIGQNRENAVSIKAGGAIYRIDLSIVTMDGKENKPDSFETPVELSLPYEAGADESILGVYYFNENTKAWEYVGGTLDKSGKRITVQLSITTVLFPAFAAFDMASQRSQAFSASTSHGTYAWFKQRDFIVY